MILVHTRQMTSATAMSKSVTREPESQTSETAFVLSNLSSLWIKEPAIVVPIAAAETNICSSQYDWHSLTLTQLNERSDIDDDTYDQRPS